MISTGLQTRSQSSRVEEGFPEWTILDYMADAINVCKTLLQELHTDIHMLIKELQTHTHTHARERARMVCYKLKC